ncbi:MAG: fatty acid desaturase [Pseudomonadales bacterium]|nr:fatty acid desaturase [Pseudomonadales bacterium]
MQNSETITKNASEQAWQAAMPQVAWGTIFLFLGILLGYAVVIPAAVSGEISYPLATLICSYLAFASFTVAHDAGHGNIFQLGSPLKPLESVIGWAASVPLILVPYRFFQKIHDRHHAFTNDPGRDPDYMPDANSWLDVVKGAYSVPFKYHWLALTKLKNVKVIRDTYPSTVTFILLVMGTLLGLSLNGFALEVLCFAIIPLVVAIFFLAMFFDYLPHHPHKSLARFQNTRIYEGRLWNILLLGQNYHLIHHLYPRLPWYKYQQVFYKTLPELEAENAPLENIGMGARPRFLKSPHAAGPGQNAASIHQLLKVSEIERLTSDAVSITFEMPENSSLNYQAGQYITVSKWLNDAQQTRCYSLCEAPGGDQLKIAVRETPNGLVSSYLNQMLSVGDELIVEGPFGDFVFPPKEHKDIYELVLIAGGSGITPILAIVETALKSDPALPIHLIYACRDNQSIMFFEYLQALAAKHPERFKISYVIENPGDSVIGSVGRLNESLLGDLLDLEVNDQLIENTTKTEFYICGPEAMKDAVVNSLTTFGVNQQRVHIEQFVATVTAPIGELKAVEIYTANGHLHQLQVASNQTVLEVAKQQGVNIPHACGNGTCGSCKLKVEAGASNEIPDSIPGILEEEKQAGFTLACQCKPLSDLTLTERTN